MNSKKRIVIFNFKTYRESTGKNAVKLAELISRLAAAAKKKDLLVVVAPTAFDLSAVRKAAGRNVEIFAQHLDPVELGKSTGWLSPENAKLHGAAGTIINHAEHQMPLGRVKETIGRCKAAGLMTVVCVKNSEEAVQVAAFAPDYISVEFPELIGSLKSVSVLRPQFVSDAAEAVRKVSDVPTLCGAGISSGADVKAALELGTRGVILAAYIDLAKDKKKAIKEILSGF